MHLFCVQVVPLHLSQMQFFGLCDREEYVLGHSLYVQSTKVKAIGVKAALYIRTLSENPCKKSHFLVQNRVNFGKSQLLNMANFGKS